MRKCVLFLILLTILVSCKTVDTTLPENAGAVIDTQSAVAADTAAIVSGAKSADDEARDLSSALETAAATTKNPEITKIADLAVKHTATTAALVKSSLKLEKDVELARLQVVLAVKNQSIANAAYHTEHTARITAEWQRNTIALIAFLSILGIIATGFIVWKIQFKK